NGFTLSGGYNLRNISYNVDGVTIPYPTISINGGAPISLTNCLWPQSPTSAYPGYPNFFFPIPQPPADRTIIDDRSCMVFDGKSAYAATASNLAVPKNASFVLCFRATNPSASPVIAAQGTPASGGWQISLGGTAEAMTVTFQGGGHTLSVSQLTGYIYNGSWNSFGQGYPPMYTGASFSGPTNLVANEWYRVILTVDPSAGATLIVANDGYALTDGNSNVRAGVAAAQATNSTLVSWPQLSAPLYLGCAASGGSYLSGKIGEIQVYAGTLSLSNVLTISIGGWLDFSAPRIAVWWPDLRGTTVADISGSGAPALNPSASVSWDNDTMVTGYHAVEGVDLSSSHGTFQCAGGTWTPVRWQFAYGTMSANGGFNGRYWYSSAPGASATFANTSLTAGRSYSLALAYVPDFDRTTDALVTVYDGQKGGTVLGTVNVNQTTPCAGFTWDRYSWLPLGTFTPSGTTMTVVITNKAGSGKLVADAIRFEGVLAPVSIGSKDTATIALPLGWATLGPDSGTDTLPAAPGYSVAMVNRSGDMFNQAVKTNPKTMKVGYDIGPVTEYGPSYLYRNRFKDQYFAGSVSAYNNPQDHLRGQCDVTPSGLWTVTYKTPDGAGNHVKLSAGDSFPPENMLGSTVTDNGETISGGVATRTYTVTGTPARNSPMIGVSLSGNVDQSTISILPPDPSNPSHSLPATDGSGSAWHPNFQANMSVWFSALRYMMVDDGNIEGYNLAVLSDYNQTLGS
ncbi:MAG: hypothetical protein JO252_25130, partial [Planctomycetaceae bacterium]|nr:hypothetical protein [Planctomycetaceae bacterium]